MKIMVVGLGSMGRRRLRIIKELKPESFIIGIDKREGRRRDVNAQYGVECFENMDDFKERVDCVFVCTPPLSHNAIIHKSLTMGCHVFTELNLVSDGYEENMELAEREGLLLFLSSTFLYREEVRRIIDKVSNARWNYIYHVGQYLPNWHPWEDYRELFLGDKKTNACREILAIELPWLITAFGDVVDVDVITDKLTDLDIGYQDSLMAHLSHEGGNRGTLIVEVVSPVAIRRLEVYGENAYISWEGNPESLSEYNHLTKEMEKVGLYEQPEHMDGYSSLIVENAYKNETRSFFDMLSKNEEPAYGFKQDLRTLRLIDMIGA